MWLGGSSPPFRPPDFGFRRALTASLGSRVPSLNLWLKGWFAPGFKRHRQE
jgi:hypothetical protein